MKSKTLVCLLMFSMLMAGCSGAKQATTAPNGLTQPATSAPLAATTTANPPATAVGNSSIGVNFPVDVNSTVAAQNHLGVTSGVLCVQIVPGGPADKAGLKADDVITTWDGIAVTNCVQLGQLIKLKAPGMQVNITYFRGTSEFNVTLTLDAKPPATS